MFEGEPMKLTKKYELIGRKRLEYEFTNIFTNEKLVKILPDLKNYGSYWRHWSQGEKNFISF
jgi:hypothetical protein